ncbi:hypothetical protein [Streptomyces sp. NPDC048644]|uniref:hypothetical protein n=1 Tax=Streptomyces sp. NPDC048644 TaxID=3365582 RepID=UPI00371CE31B
MPWVRLDDRFPSHRKVALLSDKAFRLYVSGLCWVSENLTEGKILDRELKVISRIRGPKTAAAELVDAGLWERIPDGYLIHDYLEYNPDRARVKADREANAARQKAFRERKRTEREAAKKAAEEGPRNADRNGVTRDAEDAPGDTKPTAKRRDGNTNAEENTPEKNGHPQVNAIRNGVSNAAPSRPVLPSPSEKEKEGGQLATRAGTTDLPHIGDRPQIPAPCQPLVDALQAARLHVGWDLRPQEWFLIEALIQRCGIPALVASATASWQGARSQPRSGRYFLPAWRALPDVATATPADLPTAVGGQVVPFGPPPRPSTTDARVQQAIAVGRRLQAIADAKTQEAP